jgi:NAD(P)H-hydrate epimerase
LAIFVDHAASYVQLRMVDRFAHKGIRGHVLLGAGSASMMGAAVMAAKAALRSGAGLVTVATDAVGWPVLQQAAPEAICAAKGALANESFQLDRRVKTIGVGPGWLADNEHLQLLAWLLEQGNMPLVIDATALQMLHDMKQALAAAASKNPVVLTPHPGEFDRLFGTSKNSYDRLHTAREMASKWHVFILLKGAYSRIITPDGKCYVNSTGNHGMAKGGSGDVLTGLLTGLLAQGYSAQDACILAAWLHGKAGDFAAEKYSTEGMTAMSIVEFLPLAWKALHRA